MRRQKTSEWKGEPGHARRDGGYQKDIRPAVEPPPPEQSCQHNDPLAYAHEADDCVHLAQSRRTQNPAHVADLYCFLGTSNFIVAICTGSPCWLNVVLRTVTMPLSGLDREGLTSTT